MTSIGIGLIWVGYTGLLYSWCLFRGYNVTPKQLLSPTWPPKGGWKEAGESVADAIGKAADASVKGAVPKDNYGKGIR